MIEKESVSNHLRHYVTIQSPLWKIIEFAVYFKISCSQFFFKNNCSQVKMGGQLLKVLIEGHAGTLGLTVFHNGR